MVPRVLGLLVVLVVVAAAALLVEPNQADAENGYCPAIGIIPGSVSVTSTNNGAGQVSAHKVKFQLCGAIGGPEVYDVNGNVIGPPDKIGLLWQGFSLDEPGNAEVALSVTGGNRWWWVTTEIARGDYKGVAIEFTPEQVDWLEQVAGLGPPLSLEFTIPLSAEMRNPEDMGNYRWDVMLFHVLKHSCEPSPGDFVSTIVPPYIPGELQLYPKSGKPGTRVTVIGQGLEPLVTVQSVKAGGVDVTPRYNVFTDGLGDFELEFTFPGLRVDYHPVSVQVGETTLVKEFFLGGSRMFDPIRFAREEFRDLGRNFVRAFHFNGDTKCWTFYDPEFPDESNLNFLFAHEYYWILVHEPAEIILGNTTRNLTCTPEGNCWNQIVW